MAAASRTPGPAYDQLIDRASEAIDECDCPCFPVRQRVERINRLLAAARSDYPGLILADVRPTVGDLDLEATRRAVGVASTFAQTYQMGKAQPGVYLYGMTGNGKTYVASALLNELIIRTAQPGLFVNVTQQLFPRLRATYEDEGRAETELQVMTQLARVPHLVLDDLGVERNTKWEAEVLYNIIDSRYRRRRPIIVTSNLAPDDAEMKALSRGRITSRLKHMCRVVKMPDEDLRPFFDYAIR
jgi:DNA replication protein DnaC